MSDYDRELFKQAVYHIKAGEYEPARRFLERALDAADDNDTRLQASFWLSEITEDKKKKRALLEDVLAIDHFHAQARRALAIMDGKLKPEDIVNPDRLPASSTEPQADSAERFICPKCGGKRVFAPDGQSLVCEYCDHKQILNSGGASGAERDFFLAMAKLEGHRQPVAMHAFACKGCGSRFMLAPEVISATCAYCGSAHVINVNEMSQVIPPDAIIPMAFSQRRAAFHLVDWVNKNKIIPEGKVQAPRGVYLPIWLFDVAGEIEYRGYIVKDNDDRSNNWAEANTNAEKIQGGHPIFLNDIPVPASDHFSGIFEKVLDDYFIDKAAAYDPRYLADWHAEIHKIPMADASLSARSVAYQRERRNVRAHISGNVQEFTTSSARISIEGFKLILVPVWFTTYRNAGKDFSVLINGQTGETVGETPQDSSNINIIKDWIDDLFQG